jgi:iron complex outermembrane receptor protein
MSFSFLRPARGLVAVSAFALALPGFAQDAAPAAEPAAAPSGIEEIVITSTKREENIQDVPIAVSAFTADDLLNRGIDEVEELEEISPSIQINTSNSASNGGTIRIRGMGTTGNNPGLEAAVGSFVDGIYRSRAGQTFGDLLDIERVEVLRGPQGTLFGKNTSAGAIHVITKKPNLDEMEGFAAVEIGNLDHRRISVSNSAPIVEGELGYRISATWNQRDGYIEDIHSSKAWGNRDRYSLRGQLLWTPSDAFSMRLIGDYAERDESCCPGQTLYYGPSSNRFNQAAGVVPGFSNNFGAQELATSIGLGKDFIDIPTAFINPTNCIGAGCVGPYPYAKKSKQSAEQREVGVNYAPFEDVADWGLSLEMNYDMDWATLTSITGYRDFHAQYGEDIDFTSADILRPQQDLDDISEILSQEFRLVGTWDRLDWLFGAYVYGEELHSDERLEFGSQAGLFALGSISAALAPALPAGAGYSAVWEQSSDGYAFFTHNTFHVTDAFSVTGGFRYSHEQKVAFGILNNGAIALKNGQVQTGNGFVVGQQVPAGVNDAVTGGLLPGNAGWCEELTSAGLGAVRNVLRGFCDNASWEDKATENEYTGQVSLAYAITDDINVYATYSRGYKAGGYNLDQESVDIITASATGLIAATPQTTTGIVDEAHFKPEFANAYEVGIKGTYLDGRARINIAGFWTDFSDFQLNTFNGLGFIISNVDEVRSRGFELETLLAPMDGVTVNFGVTYADTRYGKGIGLCFPLQYADGSNNNCDANSPTPNIPGSNDTGPQAPFSSDFFADHHRITNAPAWSGNLSIYGEHQLVASEWMGYGNFGVRYTGRRNTGSNLHPLKFEPSHYFLQASVGVRSPDGHWDASVWSNNLSNEYENNVIADSVFQGGSQTAYFNIPRTFGLTVKYNFN